MAYTLGNKCAKNCCKRTNPVQLIVKDVVTCFLEHSVEWLGYPTVTKFQDMFICFDTIHEHDRQTDRRTDRHHITAKA